jgi:DNA-binding transcriptional ArsR family regulator
MENAMERINYTPQSRIYKALNHPVRLAILEILRKGDECVCHMEAVLGLRQAYISQHLTVLREAGLIQDRRDGWNNYYQVVDPEIYRVIDGVNQFAGASHVNPDDADPVRSPQPGCPCPKCKSSTLNEIPLVNNGKEER